jgi:DNA polymerase-3 subunit epsilon
MKTLKWYEKPFIGFDTETTGLDPKTARILQAAIVTHDLQGILAEEDRILYIDPGVPIPLEASDIHGITAEKLNAQQAQESSTGIPYIFGNLMGRATFRGYPLVIYNVCYDWPLLMAECARIAGFDYQNQPVPSFLDPLVIDRALDKYARAAASSKTRRNSTR